MSSITIADKRALERLFGMESGYVLNFSNRTFEEFVLDSVGIDIYDDKYATAGESKANRLRVFWRLESDHVTGNLLSQMLDLAIELFEDREATLDYARAKACVEKLLGSSAVFELQEVASQVQDESFEPLIKMIRDSISQGQPETGLDRLHTFVVKYVRTLLEAKGIYHLRNEPLNSLFGKYVKDLKARDALESEMTERILKTNISILEQFNFVRNNHSFAHDNAILNRSEATLIVNHVVSVLRFIMNIEQS